MECMALVGRDARDRRYGGGPCPQPAKYEYPFPSAVTLGTFQKRTCARHTPPEFRNSKYEMKRVGQTCVFARQVRKHGEVHMVRCNNFSTPGHQFCSTHMRTLGLGKHKVAKPRLTR